MADFVDKVTGDLSSFASGVREADDARKSRVESAGRRLMGDSYDQFKQLLEDKTRWKEEKDTVFDLKRYQHGEAIRWLCRKHAGHYMTLEDGKEFKEYESKK